MDFSYDYYFDKEGRVGNRFARNKNDGYSRYNVEKLLSLNDGTEVALEYNDVRNIRRVTTDKKDIEKSTWEEYGNATDIEHFGNDKLVIRTYSSEKIGEDRYSPRIYKVYYIFYHFQNGVWSREHVVKAPGFGTSTSFNGEMIPLNENTLVINSKDYGLYVVEYN